MFDGKVPFGTTDKSIQSYAAKADTPALGLERTNTMVSQINSILSIEKSVLTNTRKRFLKYLLLLAGLNYVDFSSDTEIKLKRLKEIEE